MWALNISSIVSIFLLGIVCSPFLMTWATQPQQRVPIRPSELMRIPDSEMNFQSTVKLSDDLLQKLGGSLDDWIVDPMTWNPMEVDKAIMELICALNIEFAYPNPANCSQAIICASGRTFLGACPGMGTYNPFANECVYNGAVPQCPWRSAWNNSESLPTCENIGQNPFWGNLTLAGESDVLCGSPIKYCNGFETVEEGECPDGCGYSKAVMACLPYDVCVETEEFFEMPYPPMKR